MSEDAYRWEPLRAVEVAELLSGLEVPRWIADGCAIGLLVGWQTRVHGDTDVLIRREDQLEVQAHLADWDLYRANYPGPVPWKEGEYLRGRFDDTWCRPHPHAPWRLQLMLLDTDGGQWVFKRDRSIRGWLSDIGRRSPDGVPYLAPEVQLLYKAKSRTLEKDQADFEVAVPLMFPRARAWLLRCLEKRFPEGHIWIEELRA